MHRLFSAAKRSTLLQHSPAPMSSLPCPLPSSCILPSLLLPSASLSPHPLACNLVSLDLWARHTVRTECGCAGRASGGGDLPVTEVIRASNPAWWRTVHICCMNCGSVWWSSPARTKEAIDRWSAREGGVLLGERRCFSRGQSGSKEARRTKSKHRKAPHQRDDQPKAVETRDKGGV